YVASKLGLGDVPAYDLAAVCSGFIFALAQANAAVLSGQSHNVLVIGADAFSSIINPEDRNTAVIFGDGAGAVVIGPSYDQQSDGLSAFELRSDGSQKDLIMVAAGGAQIPLRDSTSDSDRFFAM